MADSIQKLYYPIMRFLVSLYTTANPLHQEIFYTVPRAGHLVAGAEHRIQRDHFPGHELILCLRGRGFVRVSGVTHGVNAGDFVWVNCHQPHEHGGSAEAPWEVMWIRVEGPRLDRMCEILSVAGTPVFSGIDTGAARPLYQEIFRLMASDAPDAPARLHAEVARLLALAFCARQRHQPEQMHVPAALRGAVERMRLFYFEPHRVEALAAAAGMSASHFSRVFRAAFGTSPIDWLRRERINQAKRRLSESADPIERIAAQVGYNDRFFFSRDFKKLTGYSPREFRRREAAGVGADKRQSPPSFGSRAQSR